MCGGDVLYRVYFRTRIAWLRTGLLPNNFSQFPLFQQPDEFLEMSETKIIISPYSGNLGCITGCILNGMSVKHVSFPDSWSDMYMNPKHPKFVGCKPNRHPDEKCY